MAMEYWCFFNSYDRTLSRLSDAQLGKLVRALTEYNMTGEVQELSGAVAIAYDFITAEIDRAKDNYEEKCRRNSANGSLSPREIRTAMRRNVCRGLRCLRRRRTLRTERYRSQPKKKQKQERKRRQRQKKKQKQYSLRELL